MSDIGREPTAQAGAKDGLSHDPQHQDYFFLRKRFFFQNITFWVYEPKKNVGPFFFGWAKKKKFCESCFFYDVFFKTSCDLHFE